MISIQPSKTIVNKQEIQDYEENLKLNLPEDYILFLEEYNGGRPEPNFCEFDEGSLSVCDFFGINVVDSINNLNSQRRELVGRIPEKSLPIARTEFGNLLILALDKSYYGQIYLWEHEIEEKKFDKMILIARSFGQLMEKILPYDVKDVDLSGYEVLNVSVDQDFLKELQDKKQ